MTAEDQVMIEKVAAPAFFAKVASVTGLTPHNADAANDLRLLADHVAAGVQRYREKVAAARTSRTNDLVKAAGAAIGLRTPQPAPSAPTDFLADGEVYAAAAGLLAKRANAAAPALVAPVAKPDDDEDDKEPKPAAPAVA